VSSAAELKAGGGGRFELLGSVDFETVPQLWEQSMAQFLPHERLQVDLSGVSHAGSAALALLLAWLRWARRRGKTLELEGLPAKLRSLVELSDLEELIPPA
jgi:phospholipid transport system transporter-binding protein